MCVACAYPRKCLLLVHSNDLVSKSLTTSICVSIWSRLFYIQRRFVRSSFPRNGLHVTTFNYRIHTAHVMNLSQEADACKKVALRFAARSCGSTAHLKGGKGTDSITCRAMRERWKQGIRMGGLVVACGQIGSASFRICATLYNTMPLPGWFWK
jgi:hypothetical protein